MHCKSLLVKVPWVTVGLSLLNLLGLAVWASQFSRLLHTIEDMLILTLSIDVHDIYLVAVSSNLFHAAIALVALMTVLTLVIQITLAYSRVHNMVHVAISTMLWILWLFVDVFLFLVAGGFSIWLAVTIGANFAIATVQALTTDFIKQTISILQALNATGLADIEAEVETRVETASGYIGIALNASAWSVAGLVFLCIGCICILCSLSWELALLHKLMVDKKLQLGSPGQSPGKGEVEMQTKQRPSEPQPGGDSQRQINVTVLDLESKREDPVDEHTVLLSSTQPQPRALSA